MKKGLGEHSEDEIVLPGKSLLRKRIETLASYKPAEKVNSGKVGQKMLKWNLVWNLVWGLLLVCTEVC